jgi:hypothetical protein
MKRLLLIVLIIFRAALPAAAQGTDICTPAGLESFTQDFLRHFIEIDKIETELFIPNYRLNLFGEYITFLMACRKPPSCDTLSTTYTEAVAAAQTRDELAIISAKLTADVIICQPVYPLTAILDQAGFECNVLYADETSATLECTGENELSTAQGLYQVMRETQPQLEQISVTLTSGDSESRYIYTGQEWLVEKHYGS